MRGHQANSWHLRQWAPLADRYELAFLQTRSNWFDTSAVPLRAEPVTALRDLLPRGPLGHALARVPGDRYLNAGRRLRGWDVVHSQDLGFWYSMQAARHRPRLGYRLVLTVWETIPFLDAFRNVRTRRYRRLVLERTDLFLAATERARAALLLEGAPPERVRVCPPGVDRTLFAPAGDAPRPAEHVVVSPGRLVWEKGHHDVLRAVAALRHRALDGLPDVPTPRVLVIGDGPEERRLRTYARELGIGDRVEVRPNVPYAEMPRVYAEASAMVLASLPVWFWEEQFGMVLAEAMAAGLAVLASDSGAIPEVTAGQVPLFPAGDWVGLARLLATGPLARRPGERVRHDEAVLEGLSAQAAARRLAAAYDALLGS